MTAGPSTTVSAELDLDLAAALERQAEERDESKAQIVRVALRELFSEEMSDDIELIDYEIKQLEEEMRGLEQQIRFNKRELEEKQSKLRKLRGAREDVRDKQVEDEFERLEQAEPDRDNL